MTGTGKRTTLRRILLTGAISGLVLLLNPAAASAHGSVEETMPEDGSVVEELPESLVMYFNEDVTTSPESMRLVDAGGAVRQLDELASQPGPSGYLVEWDMPDDLDKGWYAAAWRAVSADGHPINGSFTFFYGDPGSAAAADKAEVADDPTALYVNLSHLLRAVTYLAVLLAVGMLLAGWAVSGPRTLEHSDGTARFTRRVATAAAVAGLVLTPLHLFNSAVILNGGSFQSIGVIVQIVLQSSAGAALLVRMSALFGLCTAVLLIPERGTRRFGAAIGALSAAALMISYPMAGHASVVPWKWVASVSEVLHLLAGAAWLGGIPAVAYFATKHRHAPVAVLHEVIKRFSRIATVSVIIVGVAGSVLAASMLTSPAEIVSTRYGVTMVVKIALVALVGAAGAYNHFVVLPALRRAEAEGTEADEPHGVRLHLKGTLLGEAAMLVLVVAATAALTSAAAPAAGDNHFAGGGHSHGGFGVGGADIGVALADLEPRMLLVPVGEGEARLDYLPGRSDSENRFLLSVTNADGSVRDIAIAEASIGNETLGIGPIEREFTRIEDGSWVLLTRDLGAPGQWSMELLLTFQDGEVDSVVFTVDIRPPAGEEIAL